MLGNWARKESFPLEVVRLKNSCESHHLFCRDIDAIDFARVYSRWSRPTASVVFYISIASHRGLTSASEHSCSQAALSSCRKVFLYDIAMTMVSGGGGGRIGVKHLKSVCSSGTHRKSYVPLLAPFHMLYYHILFLAPPASPCYVFLPLAHVRNPKKSEKNHIIANPWNKSLGEKKNDQKRSRQSFSTQANCHLFLSD